jgi:tetratricopeptide (TPR) repeat protein
VRTFFLFYLLTWLFRNPLIALVVVAAVVYLADARWRGRWFDPSRLFRNRRAIAELRRTISLNEHNAAAHNDLGRLLALEGKHEQAREHLERAIRRMDDSPETNYYYGLTLLQTGQRQEGERLIRRALEINPRFAYGEPLVTLARVRLEAGDAEDARKSARDAVRLNTSSIEGWVVLARAEQRLGDRDAARKAYESARDAYRHLPAYLHLPNRKWLVAAKRGLRSLRA